MFVELRPSAYWQVRPLFEGLNNNLVVESILSGNTLGRVFVRPPSAPRAAVIWNTQDTLLLAGPAEEPDELHSLRLLNAVRSLILGKLAPDARIRWIPQFVLQPASPAWSMVVRAALADLYPVDLPRRHYILEEPVPTPLAVPPEGVRLVRMDAHFLELAGSAASNAGEMLGWVRSFWRTNADFLASGLGYAVLVGDALASWCLSVYASRTRVEFGVGTVQEFRGRGLATLAAAAALNAGLAAGQVPEWHCDLENAPSVRLAEKMGLRLRDEYSAMQVNL